MRVVGGVSFSFVVFVGGVVCVAVVVIVLGIAGGGLLSLSLLFSCAWPGVVSCAAEEEVARCVMPRAIVVAVVCEITPLRLENSGEIVVAVTEGSNSTSGFSGAGLGRCLVASSLFWKRIQMCISAR